VIERRGGCEDGRVTPDPKAWLWFLSSYAPLWIMLGLRFSSHVARISLIAFGAACIAYLVFIVSRSAGERPSNATLTITGDAGADVSGYLAAYLLPFLTVPKPSLTDVIAYVIFVLVAGLVYVRSGLMQINPTIYLMGRRVLRATVPVRETTKEVFVISRRDLRVAAPLQAERFSDRVFIDHGAPN
jgi:hypothetical protein